MSHLLQSVCTDCGLELGRRRPVFNLTNYQYGRCQVCGHYGYVIEPEQFTNGGVSLTLNQALARANGQQGKQGVSSMKHPDQGAGRNRSRWRGQGDEWEQGMYEKGFNSENLREVWFA